MNFKNFNRQGDILIVDDLIDNLRVLSDTLAGEGHRVRAVRSGPMALLGAKTAPPDVILLDIRMPTMDGFEVCRQLKTDVVTQHIPVIFLSALDEAADKIRAFEAGGVDYITKPFQAVEVQARVRHQLTIQQLQKQVIAQLTLPDSPTSTGSGQPGGAQVSHRAAIQAVNTALAYAAHLTQTPNLPSHQSLILKDLQQHGQAMLNILSALGK